MRSFKSFQGKIPPQVGHPIFGPARDTRRKETQNVDIETIFMVKTGGEHLTSCKHECKSYDQ